MPRATRGCVAMVTMLGFGLAIAGCGGSDYFLAMARADD